MKLKSLLRVPSFVSLMLAYTLNELAWSVGTLALAFLVYKRTGSALGSTGFFLLSQVVPGFVAPLLIPRLERLAPRRLLPGLYWLEAVLFAILAWFTSRFALAPVLALVLIDGVVALIARSLAGAVRADILKPLGLLHEGNALTNTVFSVCFLVGPLIGGAVVAFGGTVSALLANCGLFAVIGAALALTTLPAHAEPEASSPKGRLRAGIAHVRSDPLLRNLLSLQGVGVVFFTISTPVEVVYAEHTLRVGADGYGAIVAAWGGGAVLGSIIYARWARTDMRVLMTGGALVIAAGLGVMAVAPGLVVALVGAALAGIANGMLSTAFMTETQDRTPKDWMALVTTLLQSIRQISPGLGIMLGGVLASAGSSRLAFAVAGAGCLLFALATFVLLAPARRATGEARRAGSRAVDDAAGPTDESPVTVGDGGVRSPSSEMPIGG
ncbi:MAG TPA: MFS transporter [Solirubrobacteraceae bacterium]|nr:MFS transporter [Solirubrobacteraceae bacterium]